MILYLSIVKILAALRREDGQDLVEYGLVLLIVAVAAIAVVSTFGSGVVHWYLAMPGRLFGG